MEREVHQKRYSSEQRVHLKSQAEREAKVADLRSQGLKVQELIEPNQETALLIRLGRWLGYVVVADYFRQPNSDGNWLQQARCVGLPVEYFSFYQVEYAKKRREMSEQVCHQCPVRVDCLEDSLAWRDFNMMRAGLLGSGSLQRIAFHRSRIIGADVYLSPDSVTVAE